MSAVPSIDQRIKGHGQAHSTSKDGITDHEEFDAWRNIHHQNYGPAMSTSLSDPYLPSYYGASFPYQAFGVGDGAWSNGGDPITYSWSVSGQMGHDSYNMDGVFGPPGSFGNFGQPGYNYGFHGSGDYSGWGGSNIRRSHYEDHYTDRIYNHDDRNSIKAVEQGMQGISLTDRKEHKELIGKDIRMEISGIAAQSKKTTWASIASQPARPQPLKTKKLGLVPTPVIPGKYIDIGTWEAKNGGKTNVISQPSARPSWLSPRGRGIPPSYISPQQPPIQLLQQQNLVLPPVANPILDDLKLKNEYNPKEFDLNPKGARYFVIKSYSEDDIHRSIKYEIWCSTEHGNKRLDTAFREREGKGPIYLYFSVNGSGHFCGMAQMVSAVDYSSSSSVWAQDKWKGQFKVKWIYVKDLPNSQLRHIRLENNENKPVTNSRDTQEIPPEKGKQVLKIIHIYKHSTSIFDDFIHYEKRQEEEDARRLTNDSPVGNSTGVLKEDRVDTNRSRGRNRN